MALIASKTAMLVYANQTPDGVEAFPPFLTMAVDAMAFQSVTAFAACRRLDAGNDSAKSSATVCSTLMMNLLWPAREYPRAGCGEIIAPDSAMLQCKPSPFCPI